MNKTIINYIDSTDQKLSKLRTDSPMWPYLSMFTEGVSKLIDIDLLDNKIIFNGYLESLNDTIINISKNVLFAELELLNSTHSKEVNTNDFYKLLIEDKSYLKDIINNYPELNRLLSKITCNYQDRLLEMIESYYNDENEIKQFFLINKHANLIKLSLAKGESHNGHARVGILEFENDENIVYKPRDLHFESHVSNILLEFIKLNNDTDWFPPKIIAKDNYGWCEFKGHKPITRIEDANKFYNRMGFFLGFSTVLNASDITADNIIANGQFPVPVDMETFFYNSLDIKSIPKEVRWNSSLTGMLPNWGWKGIDGIGVDLSAIGGLKQQYVSLNLYQHLQEDGKDKYGMDGVSLLPNKNVLYLKDSADAIKPWHYTNDIISGFQDFAKLAETHKDFLEGEIVTSKKYKNRFVPRSTAAYHYAVQCSLFPSLLADTAKRHDFLRKILDNENTPSINFLESELKACMDHDVPFAQGKVGSLDFVEPYYKGTGSISDNEYIDGVENSLIYLNDGFRNRINFEEKLIGNVLLAMKSMYEHEDNLLTKSELRKEDPIDKKQSVNSIKGLIENALNENLKFIKSQIAEELDDNGLWLGFHASAGGYMEYSELGDDFYYGLTGIVYGCVILNDYIGFSSETLEELVDLNLQRIHTKLDNIGMHLGGAHFGISSFILPIMKILYILEREDEVSPILDKYKNYIKVAFEDDLWQKYFWGGDYMSGMYGTLAVLSLLFQHTKDQFFKEYADELYSRIQNELVTVDGYNVMPVDNSITSHPDKILTGVSHGTTGNAYCNFIYYKHVNHDEAVYESFLDLLNFELADFNPEINNWHDYRKRSPAVNGEFAWSHGSVGIYLVLNYFSKNGVKEAEEFLNNHPNSSIFSYESFEDRRRPVNNSMCHGALGFLNIISQIDESLLEDARTYQWSNVINFSEMDCRPLRVRTADSLGLWVGKIGTIYGELALMHNDINFPYLLHNIVNDD